MENNTLTINYLKFNSWTELQQRDRTLLEKAVESAAKAYSPYSKFKVGAAIQLENGTVVTGNNQENAAYPSGLCAERVALFSASSQYPGMKILSLALAATADYYQIQHAVAPCGACRQVISEYEELQGSPIRIIFSNVEGNGVILEGIDSLLPFKFSKKDLNI